MPGKRREDSPIFVVHKHQARRLHYDFRLQAGDALASWAVPKGPSLNPANKRLAVRVEDHPLDYADFEGTIPADDYGAGTVMVWDFGTVSYKPGRPAREMLDSGLLEFELHGRKLNGAFKLVQAKLGGNADNWLLVKRKDEFARDPGEIVQAEPDSAKSGRTMEQIAAAK